MADINLTDKDVWVDQNGVPMIDAKVVEQQNVSAGDNLSVRIEGLGDEHPFVKAIRLGMIVAIGDRVH